MTTATSVHLGGRLNLALVWEAARLELLQVLGKPDLKKVIVWDEVVIGPVGVIAEVQFLRKQGVYKMVRLPTPNLTEQYPDANEYLFFTRPKIQLVEMIIEAIRTSSKKQGKRFVVVFVPQKSQHCVTRFHEYGFVDGTKVPIGFSITEFHLDMLPFDHDVISLDINTAFNDLYIAQDPTPLFRATKAICKLEAIFGVIPRIYGKGRNAQVVADQVKRMRRELTQAREVSPQIDAIVLLDRSVDFLTPLSTPLTYEALIDEIYGINYCCGKFPRQMFSEDVQQVPKGAPPPTGPLACLFISDENMFVEMRDLNFRAVGSFLSREAKKITEAYEERHDAKTVSQLKQFVQRLPHMQQAKLALSKHTTIAELIKNVTDKRYFLEQLYTEQVMREDDCSDKPNEYIESCIGMSQPVAKVLRLICMQSVANNGLKPKLLEHYKREILQGYGYEHLLSLHNLEKAGLLKQQETKAFYNLRKSLRLVTEGVDEMNPKDISYVFSGYAPLSIRLMEVLLERPNGWNTFEEVTAPLPGPAFQRDQPVARGQEKRKRPTADRPQVVLVFFLGGCSYAEISALRFLSQRDLATTEYIVVTTHITNGTSIINGILSETPHFHPVKMWDNQMDDPVLPRAKGEHPPAPASQASRPRR